VWQSSAKGPENPRPFFFFNSLLCIATLYHPK
jgi:hypothetical protein